MTDANVTARLVKVETDVTLIKNSVAELSAGFQAFLSDAKASASSSQFTRKDAIGLLVGAVAIVSGFIGGSLYLVDTRITPVRDNVGYLANQTNERFASQADTVRDLRSTVLGVNNDLSNARIELGRIIDEVKYSSKQWDKIYAKNYDARLSVLEAGRNGK